MSLNDRIARLFMTAYSGRRSDSRDAERERLMRDVVERGVGGYCIFGGDVDGTRAINEEAACAAGRPLLVASDLERGLGHQLLGATCFPCQMALGAGGSTELAEAVGWATGRDARSVGINLVFTPVADVMTNPENPVIGVRSFGEDPGAVAGLTTAYVRGCQSAGAAAAAKHFPGHGDTSVDSHLALPVVSADRATIYERELLPFRAAVDAGVRVIMTAHVAFPQLTGTDAPATLSPDVVDDILRSEMGFDGVVVTDALLMGAITGAYGSGEAAVMALEAGADILLMPGDTDEAVSAVGRALDSGRVTEERIERSLRRLEDLATWISASGPCREGDAVPGFAQVPGAVGHRCGAIGLWNLSSDELAARVASRAVTLLKDDGLLPLDPSNAPERGLMALAIEDGEREAEVFSLAQLLDDALPGTRLLSIDGRTPSAEAADIATSMPDALLLLFFFDWPAAWRGTAGPSPELVDAAARAIASHERSVVVGFAAPTLASSLTGAGAFVCCYDGSLPMQKAALDVLLGVETAAGSLPLAVRGLYPLGHRHTRG